MPDQNIINTFLILILSVVIFGGAFYALRKYIEKMKGNEKINHIKILSKQPLSAKNHIYIIEYEARRFMLGVSEKNISLISELGDNQQEITSPNQQRKNQITENLSFKEFLKSTISRS